jgi:hypothetical protein
MNQLSSHLSAFTLLHPPFLTVAAQRRTLTELSRSRGCSHVLRYLTLIPSPVAFHTQVLPFCVSNAAMKGSILLSKNEQPQNITLQSFAGQSFAG